MEAQAAAIDLTEYGETDLLSLIDRRCPEPEVEAI
jgi:hypothetical protein